VHEPIDNAKELNDGGGEEDADYRGALEGLNVDYDNLDARYGYKSHGKIEKGEEAFAFLFDWVFSVSAHDVLLRLRKLIFGQSAIRRIP
jgi:hypothetical protein